MKFDINNLTCQLPFIEKLYINNKESFTSKKDYYNLVTRAIEAIRNQYGNNIKNIDALVLENKLVAEINDYIEEKIINGESLFPVEELNDWYDLDIKTLYFRDINKEMLNEVEVRNLMNRIANGDKDAERIMIERNLRLVVSIAIKHINRGVPFLDLIQEGNIGLMKALEKYDMNKGAKFSTYATYWIKLYVMNAIANCSRTIRMPKHMHYLMYKYSRICSNLLVKLGREPQFEEVAREMDISLDQVMDLEVLKMQYGNIKSLNLLVSNNSVDEFDVEEFGNFIVDTNIDVEKEVMNEMLNSELNKVMQKLTEREKEVIELRYGLNENEVYTLEQIGKKFNVTRERIRQIEGIALKKMRVPSSKRKLEEFL